MSSEDQCDLSICPFIGGDKANGDIQKMCKVKVIDPNQIPIEAWFYLG